MDLFELTDADLRANLRGIEPGMAAQLPDEADIRAVFKHERGATAPEQVAGAGLPGSER